MIAKAIILLLLQGLLLIVFTSSQIDLSSKCHFNEDILAEDEECFDFDIVDPIIEEELFMDIENVESHSELSNDNDRYYYSIEVINGTILDTCVKTNYHTCLKEQFLFKDLKSCWTTCVSQNKQIAQCREKIPDKKDCNIYHNDKDNHHKSEDTDEDLVSWFYDMDSQSCEKVYIEGCLVKHNEAIWDNYDDLSKYRNSFSFNGFRSAEECQFFCQVESSVIVNLEDHNKID